MIKLDDVINQEENQDAEYNNAIQSACDEFMKNPDGLKAVLIQYDSLVKQQIEGGENMKLPYWCYWCGEEIKTERNS